MNLKKDMGQGLHFIPSPRVWSTVLNDFSTIPIIKEKFAFNDPVRFVSNTNVYKVTKYMK